MALRASDYLVVPRTNSSPKARLVCFPHAGGGPTAFAAWPDFFDSRQIEVVTIATPGHERRIKEAAATDGEVLVREVCEALTGSGLVDDVPYAFFGHSLGALLAVEVAKKLDVDMRPGRPRPIHLFVSGHGPLWPSDELVAPRICTCGNRLMNDSIYCRKCGARWGEATAQAEAGKACIPCLHVLDQEAMVKAIQSFGFLPAEVLADASLTAALLPAMRADFQIHETYKPIPRSEPLDMPVTSLGGKADVAFPVSDLAKWASMTRLGQHQTEVFMGGHFYLDEHRADVLPVIHSYFEQSFGRLPKSILMSSFKQPESRHTTCIHDVFREMAGKHPDAIAVKEENGEISYAQLLRRSDILASKLHRDHTHGKKGLVIALLLPHDMDYVACMQAIWMVAGNILLLETHFPATFCTDVCTESKVQVGLTNSNLISKLDGVQLPSLVLGEDWVATLQKEHIHVELAKAGPDDLGLLCMTSGTTGKPKTIAGHHEFLHLGCMAKNEAGFHYCEDDHREAFNVMFAWEISRPLVNGLTCFILPDSAMIDPVQFISYMSKWKCSRTLTTPSLLASIMTAGKEDMREKLDHMRLWWMCGEILPMTTVRPFAELLPKCKLVNDYSTWEAGDIGFACVSPRTEYEPSATFACNGVISPSAACAIIDPDTMKPVSRGVTGEIYIGGHAMSQGYYLRPELTAERFPNAFCAEMEECCPGRWYKTGDLGRFVGEPPVLELRGRMDFTVKLRGYKVGLPVVESAIGECTGVTRCSVVPVMESPAVCDSLLCFIQHDDSMSFDKVVAGIRLEAVKKIPRWMMPSYFKPLPDDAIGKGEARKLNRKYLLGLANLEELKASQEAAVLVDPAQLNAIESEDSSSEDDARGVRGIVKSVWAKSLNLNLASLDLEENFFNIGGHSALASKIAAELSNDYGLAVSALDIYSHSTLGELLDFVDAPSTTAAPVEKRSRLPRGKAQGSGSIVVVGLAGKFPGADDTEAFWENIKQGGVAATFMSKEFLRKKSVGDVANNKDYVACAYKIDHADKFDHQFFGIGRHEASLMDPQHRVFIECCWSALENGAMSPRDALSKTVVGVHAACGIDGYLHHHLDGRPLKASLDPNDILFAEMGHEKDYIATRVSYLLDFTGPSMNVNSACSSALVAAIQAAASITSGQCDAAVTGASSVTFPNLGYLYQDGLVASPDGYVRPFDTKAEGTVFGDAVVAMVLRRMDEAADNLVWGQTRGFSVSNDGGQKAGYAAPSAAGQSAAIVSAMQMMGEDPWSISYVECHATGTKIGDGIEVRGLMNSFNKVGGNRGSKEVRVALGSVKGNIGHANCAAGGTGLVKTLMMMRSQVLTPTANFETLNPKVNLDGSPFFVNTELCPWELNDKPRRAGVSSFGIGGTNAHMIMELPKARDSTDAKASWPFQILPFSAKTASALHSTAMHIADRVQDWSAADSAVARAAFTLQTGRSALPLRKALVVPSSAPEAKTLATLSTALREQLPEVDELDEMEEAARKPTVAFLFPGQGSQYFGMARGLYDKVPLFKTTVDRCCELFLAPEELGFDLRPLIFATEPAARELGEREFSRHSVMQPSMFIVEYALAQVLLAIGVAPVAMAGHSLGEYVAAVVGGLLTLESVVHAVAVRAKAAEGLLESGSMLSVVDWTEEELEVISKGQKPGLWLAAVNSPKHAVISGETQAIDALASELTSAGRKCTKLHINQAFHSGLISQAAEALMHVGLPRDKKDKAATMVIPVASNLTGGWLSANRLEDGTYWSKHMRGTVLWQRNIEKVMAQWKPAVFVEVGPGNSLSTLTSKCVGASEGAAPQFLQSMRHPKATSTDDVQALLSTIARLWEVGCPIDWQALHTKVLRVEQAPVQLMLPTYRFDQISLWANPERSVYVDESEDPAPAAYADAALLAEEPAAGSASSSVLLRFGEVPTSAPSIRAYCLPFASGSSTLFAPWCKSMDEAVEVVAVELPGRGGRSDEAMPSSDADDELLLEDLCRRILADLRGSQYVLVGFSMGGNLCAEIAQRMASRGAQLPLALYVAGRKPPSADPSSVPQITMSNEELAEYAFAPVEVASTPEFLENVVPLLRSDLELDSRAERRLSRSVLAGMTLPVNVGFEAYCGTNDTIAPWSAANGWQRLLQSPMGLHYFPGGHEFMKEHREAIFMSWRRDAVGRLLQRRSQEMVLLAAQGFAAPSPLPATASSPSSAGRGAKGLPLHAVRWVAAEVDCAVEAKTAAHLLDLGLDLDAAQLDLARESVQRGEVLMIACAPKTGILTGSSTLDAEVAQAARFMQVVQHLVEAGLTGRLVLLCPAATSGAMVVGASKAVALEASELRIQRVFAPPALLRDAPDQSAAIVALADRHAEESDIWVRSTSLRDQAFVPRIEEMVAPSSKLSCVPKCANGEPATYVLTGATGGLGRAVVSWLIHAQGLKPEQLVLLRRQGSAALPAELANCRAVEVAQPQDPEAVLSSGLKELHNVVGVFHLAGALDDGIMQHMTEKRFASVAAPKCGILLALLQAVKTFDWPVKWTIGFSSTSSLFGFSGQSNYCAANAMLDQMAVFDTEELPFRFISINWGPWGEAGMAQKGTKAYEKALEEGEVPLSTATALGCLAAAVRIAGQVQPMAVQLCASDVQWEKSPWSSSSILELVHSDAAPASPASASSKAGAASPTGALAAAGGLEGFMLKQMKSGGNWNRIQGKTLFDLGLDSLETVVLRNAFNKHFKVTVPLSIMADPSQKLGALVKVLGQYVKA